jgi:hypothetical protein
MSGTFFEESTSSYREMTIAAPLCDSNREETTFHLFFSCPFSAECWRQIGYTWNFNLDFHVMMHDALQNSASSFFMEIF